MAESRPTYAIIPLQRIKPAQTINFNLINLIGIAQNIIPCHTQLLTALGRISKKHHRRSLDVVVVF